MSHQISSGKFGKYRQGKSYTVPFSVTCSTTLYIIEDRFHKILFSAFVTAFYYYDIFAGAVSKAIHKFTYISHSLQLHN